MKTSVTALLIIFWGTCSFGQTDTLNFYKIREFGINTTPFLQQFVGIGNVSNRLVSFGLGLHFDSESFIQQDQLVHISLGGERRISINEKWNYYFGYGGFINARPDFSGNDVFGNGVGADIVLGIVFQINKHLSLSTETIVAATIGDGFTWKLSPPLSLYFNFRTFRKTYY